MISLIKRVLVIVVLFISFLYPQTDNTNIEKTSDKLINPLSDLWSLQFQNNFVFLEGKLTLGSDREANVFLFQPVTPVPLGDNWNIVNRTIFQVISTEVPEFDPGTRSFGWNRESGVGDLRLLQLVAPNRQTGTFVGLGWNWVFPIAGSDNLGQGKWQVGPAVALATVSKTFAGGLLLQQAWSIGGDEDRADISTSSLQYFLQYRLSKTFNLGMSPLITADWKADSNERWQVPIGFGFSTLVFIGKLPVKFGAEYQYYVVKPDSYGPKWAFLLNITPVIPNIFKDLDF